MFKIHSFDLLESTQDTVKDYFPITAPYPLVVAAQQSKSRGQRGKKWESPEENLYFSFALPISLFKKPSDLCFVSGLSMANAIDLKSVKLKWPNDLFIGQSKVGGILVEQDGDVLIAGLGINVASVPNVLSSDYPIRCLREKGHEKSVEALLALFLRSFQAFFELYQSDRAVIFQKWQEKALWLGDSVCLQTDSTVISGIFHQISPDGGIILGKKTYYSGSLRKA
ncbi:MAG: biotin--[acetyl-CoA-carboxylase] ligase [Alphaproteobacteria bacterium]|nr:biotin--[acetyl-CoA-carboxylase] ligase [Alphaproteobacteria bacterium]MBN2779483.1 biotin--[acetyl-CoA-carboxylase] ligase [Alphaproteobacteria bacterium]